jgi:hypothetical protein
MYCGNNKKHPDVVSKKKKIGSPYECFRKGIGIGKSLPVNDVDYAPIKSIRIYCGKSKKLPDGYEIAGNNPMCLQKGVGVGKRLAQKN